MLQAQTKAHVWEDTGGETEQNKNKDEGREGRAQYLPLTPRNIKGDTRGGVWELLEFWRVKSKGHKWDMEREQQVNKTFQESSFWSYKKVRTKTTRINGTRNFTKMRWQEPKGRDWDSSETPFRVYFERKSKEKKEVVYVYLEECNTNVSWKWFIKRVIPAEEYTKTSER